MKNRPTKLSQSGSLFNYLMGHNQTVPVVGEGATIMHWTDREAYEVLEVDEKKKTCVIQRYSPKRIDDNGMSDAQVYEYKELEGKPFTLYYKWGSWKTRSDSVTFLDEFRDKHDGSSKAIHEAYKEANGEYDQNLLISSIIPGMTKKKTSWHSVNIIFGVKREYYDFSF